jgi:glycosyltransferase involved in cell wall biosynthesis
MCSIVWVSLKKVLGGKLFMKKILFVSPTGTFDNGAEISIFNLMKYLVGQGHQVYNIAPQSYRADQAQYYDEGVKQNITTHFIPVFRWWWEDAPGNLPGNAGERASAYRDNIKEIRNYIKKNEIDLVITNTVNIFQGALAAACENIPHFWLIHEFPKDEFAYYTEKVDFIEEHADELYCVTGELHKELSSIFTNRTVKTFAPYTEIKPTTLIQGKKHRIVSVGRLSKRKNQLELIKAYQQLDRKELELVFIGAWDNDYKEECLGYIKEHKLNNIKFTGNLENPWKEITNQDICVFPSSMETYGLVYVESLLNGIPTILSDNPGHLSAFELFKFGQMYHLGDISQLVAALENTLSNYSEIKSAAVQFTDEAKEKYQIQNVYSAIIADIENLADCREKPIRHIANLISENEAKSKLTRLEHKIRRSIQMIKHRLKR